jgi:biotin transport system substrate-specific component
MPTASTPHLATLPQTLVSVPAWRHTLAGRATLAVAASLFVAAAAHASLPLWFTPVPLTFSDLAVLLVGLALGPATAFAALALYLLEGASGLPVFSPFGGPGGIAQLFGHTGGYLLAYPFAAAIAGLARRKASPLTFPRTLAFATAASALIMLSGTAWLGVILHLSPARALALAALPFLPGQLVKILAATGIATTLARRSQS